MRPLSKAITLYNDHAQRAMITLAALCVVFVFMYALLLMGTVVHAAKQTAAGRELASLTEQVSELQAAYLDKTKNLTPDLALAMGFVEPRDTSAVYADAKSVSFGVR